MRNTTQKAFTIMELLIVISILAILTAILIPTIRAIKKQHETQNPPKAQQRFTGQLQRLEGGVYILTLKDTLTGKEYIGVDNTPLMEVTRSATSPVVCEAPLSKGQ